ncbi:MAG TPA: hypothetical protein VJH96_00305 [Patescibacteria group bacterium]|nr:hypothetical protein [Patescibacteria group bacterium]
MLKIEYVWRELLYRAIEQRMINFKISDLARSFGLSTSVVSHALRPLRDLHIVEIGKNNSHIRDSEKLLFFWATRRNLTKDIIYQTYSPISVFEREAAMPPEVSATAYSACHLYHQLVPADYGEVYFYAQKIEEVQKRFPFVGKKNPNTFILTQDRYFHQYKKITLAQIFVDLWNLPEWYAKDFQEAILVKIKEKIGL